jgi:hypothetical protein
VPVPGAGDDPAARSVQVSDWLRIDVTMDNTGAVERVGGDPELAEAAGRVRAAGWRALRSHPRRGEGPGGWPPLDTVLEIELRSGDWDVVRQEIARWREVAVELLAGNRTDHEAADLLDSVRWSDAMLTALDEGTAAPRSGH